MIALTGESYGTIQMNTFWEAESRDGSESDDENRIFVAWPPVRCLDLVVLSALVGSAWVTA